MEGTAAVAATAAGTRGRKSRRRGLVAGESAGIWRRRGMARGAEDHAGQQRWQKEGGRGRFCFLWRCCCSTSPSRKWFWFWWVLLDGTGDVADVLFWCCSPGGCSGQRGGDMCVVVCLYFREPCMFVLMHLPSNLWLVSLVILVSFKEPCRD